MPLGFQTTASVTGTYVAGPARPVFAVTVAGDSIQIAHVGDHARPAVSIGYGGTCEDGKAASAVTWTTSDARVATGGAARRPLGTRLGADQGRGPGPGRISPRPPAHVVGQ